MSGAARKLEALIGDRGTDPQSQIASLRVLESQAKIRQEKDQNLIHVTEFAQGRTQGKFLDWDRVIEEADDIDLKAFLNELQDPRSLSESQLRVELEVLADQVVRIIRYENKKLWPKYIATLKAIAAEPKFATMGVIDDLMAVEARQQGALSMASEGKDAFEAERHHVHLLEAISDLFLRHTQDQNVDLQAAIQHLVSVAKNGSLNDPPNLHGHPFDAKLYELAVARKLITHAKSLRDFCETVAIPLFYPPVMSSTFWAISGKWSR